MGAASKNTGLAGSLNSKLRSSLANAAADRPVNPIWNCLHARQASVKTGSGNQNYDPGRGKHDALVRHCGRFGGGRDRNH